MVADDLAGYETVVVGGGILGAAIAWELSQRGMSCALFEAGTFGHESTGKSAAIVRMHYSNPQVVRMALRARELFSLLPDVLGCPPVYHPVGWLFLVDEANRENANRNHIMQLAEGSQSIEVPVGELDSYVPGINPEGIAYALYERQSGFADPLATTDAYVNAARSLGAQAYERAAVDSLVVESGRVRGVVVDGRRIGCDTVVLAAGAWSRALGRSVGIELPIQITREQDVIFETLPEPALPHSVSMQVDRTYMRPLVEEGDGLMLIGRGFPKPYDYVDCDTYTRTVDDAFVSDIRTRMTTRFPRLAGMHLRGGRVGLYSVTPDWHPLLGPVRGVEGLHLATGGSGHCFKLGPAIAEMVAGEIVGDRPDYVDIGDFRLERFVENDVFNSTYGGNRA